LTSASFGLIGGFVTTTPLPFFFKYFCTRNSVFKSRSKLSPMLYLLLISALTNSLSTSFKISLFIFSNTSKKRFVRLVPVGPLPLPVLDGACLLAAFFLPVAFFLAGFFFVAGFLPPITAPTAVPVAIFLMTLFRSSGAGVRSTGLLVSARLGLAGLVELASPTLSLAVTSFPATPRLDHASCPCLQPR